MASKNKGTRKSKSLVTKPAKRAVAGVPVQGHLRALAASTAGGAAAGALAGVIAGPPGAIVGAILGAGAGAGAEIVDAQQKRKKRRHNAELDREIGVIGGQLGEAYPDAPPTQGGTFSAASLGIASGGSTPTLGPRGVT